MGKNDNRPTRRGVLRGIGAGAVGAAVSTTMARPVAAGGKCDCDQDSSYDGDQSFYAGVSATMDDYGIHTNNALTSTGSSGSDYEIPQSHWSFRPSDDIHDGLEFVSRAIDSEQVVLWIHGWGTRSNTASSPGELNGWLGELATNAGHAFDAIVDDAGLNLDKSQRVAWLWDSNSSSTGFGNAVNKAHNIAVWELPEFLYEIARNTNELHIAAHSLGCWHLLEALSNLFIFDHIQEHTGTDAVQWKHRREVGNALESVNLITPAIPERAFTFDSDFLARHQHFGQGSTYYERGLNDWFDFTLHNVMYQNDPVLTGPFYEWMRTETPWWDSGGRDAIGAHSDGLHCVADDSGHADLSDMVTVKDYVGDTWINDHCGAYRHSDYDPGCSGGGQLLAWQHLTGFKLAAPHRPCTGDGGGDDGSDDGDEEEDHDEDDEDDQEEGSDQ